MHNVVATNGLCKTYNKNEVVKNVNITICEGDIYGFIGKNGAGKSTFMKMLVGLVKPSKGRIQLFDSKDLKNARQKIGCVIERPYLFEDFSASDNLKIFSQSFGLKENNINKIMDIIQISPSDKKAVKNFSLGMRQRVAIGIALLGNPKLLILDEPINGLDPEGIQTLRELLIHLNQEQNITMLISSHILGELSKISTKYGILHKGSLVKELSAERFEKERQQHVYIKTPDVQPIIKIMAQTLPKAVCNQLSPCELNIYAEGIAAKDIMQILFKYQICIHEITNVGDDLEKYVFTLMQEEN